MEYDCLPLILYANNPSAWVDDLNYRHGHSASTGSFVLRQTQGSTLIKLAERKQIPFYFAKCQVI